MTSSDRKKFLQSKEWKEFREMIIELHGSRCDFCRVKSKNLKLHHKDQNKDNYDNIKDIENFAVLCKACHNFIGYLGVRKAEGLPQNLSRIRNHYIYYKDVENGQSR